MIKVSRMRLVIHSGSQKSKQGYKVEIHINMERKSGLVSVCMSWLMSLTLFGTCDSERNFRWIIWLCWWLYLGSLRIQDQYFLVGKPHDNWQLQIILRITTCNWTDNKSKPLSSHEVLCKAKLSVFFPSQIFTLQQKRPKHVGRDTVMQHFLCITALTASHMGMEGIYTYIHVALYTHFQK